MEIIRRLSENAVLFRDCDGTLMVGRIGSHDELERLRALYRLFSCSRLLEPIRDDGGMLIFEQLACVADCLQSSELAVVTLAADILLALERMHDCGYAHMDVKVQNIFVRNGYLLGDLGSTQKLGEQARSLSVAYAAPEVLKNGACTRQADIYALGMTMYRLLSGDEYFSRGELIEGRLSGESLPRAACSETLWKVVERATAFNTDMRYSTASEMRAELLKSYRRKH